MTNGKTNNKVKNKVVQVFTIMGWTHFSLQHCNLFGKNGVKNIIISGKISIIKIGKVTAIMNITIKLNCKIW